MRYLLLFLAAFLLLVHTGGHPAAHAEETFMGRVVSLNPENGTMVVRPQTFGNYPEEMTIFYLPDQSPQFLEVGEVILIRGHGSPEDKTVFSASHIGYGRNRNDPTGVRSRIGKCRMFRGGGRKGHGRCKTP